MLPLGSSRTYWVNLFLSVFLSCLQWFSLCGGGQTHCIGHSPTASHMLGFRGEPPCSCSSCLAFRSSSSLSQSAVRHIEWDFHLLYSIFQSWNFHWVLCVASVPCPQWISAYSVGICLLSYTRAAAVRSAPDQAVLCVVVLGLGLQTLCVPRISDCVLDVLQFHCGNSGFF